ncbi:MAG: hypothetical protein J7K75_04995 [Desulfuromonas sp.]|nr:hypothetical protein [Desulfuromonas sp.]
MTGLTFFSDGLALVHITHSDEGGYRLRLAECVSCGEDERPAALQQLVEQHSLQHSRCVAVMARGSYNLIQIDQPDVPGDEMREAVRWQIKDLLDFPAEQAVVDTFSSEVFAGHELSFAVAASEEKVWGVVNAIRDTQLDLQAIDIPELVLRSVAAQLPEDERGVALFSLWKDSGLITISRGGELCMARRINLGVMELIAAADPTAIDGVEISEAQQNILDSVVLEIQRSLDYYESSVSRQPVSAVVIAPLTDDVPGLQSYLDTYLTPEVRSLDVASWLSDCALSTAEQSRCLSAIGAALRSEWS